MGSRLVGSSALRACVALLSSSVMAATARGEPVTLRFATLGPEGSVWAREVHGFAREIEAGTHGQVHIKWYLGGVAGDDLAELEHVRHKQLDGIGGSGVCEMVAPAYAAIRVPGLFRSREEVAYVLGRLTPLLDGQVSKAGFVSLANSVFGAEVLFSRKPVRSMADFRAQRWWTWSAWNIDLIWQTMMPLLGVSRSVATSLEKLAPVLERNGADGFIVVPSGALVWQWTTLVGYYSDLPTAMLPACLVVSASSLDPLPIEYQQIIRAAGAKLRVRWNDATASLENSLLGGLFEKQGLKKVPASPEFRAEFFAATKAARDQLGDQLVPHELLDQVERYLEEYRSGTRH
jgi:TRAP-type C4-dicarboxylate transport system substrate-binding protein